MQFGYEMSQWVNPTSEPVIMDLCLSANAEVGRADKRLKIVIPPKGTKLSPEELKSNVHQVDADGCLLFTRLPKELDQGIHHERDGVIVGGLGTRLKRLDGPQLALAPGIDSAQEDRNAALREATLLYEQKKIADEALMLAGAQQIKAEQKLAEQSAKSPKGGK